MSNPKLGKKALRSLLVATGILMSWLRKTPWPMLKYGVMAVLINEAHRQGLKAYVHAPILKFANEALRAGADGLVTLVPSNPASSRTWSFSMPIPWLRSVT